jgi:hypothetical protein
MPRRRTMLRAFSGRSRGASDHRAEACDSLAGFQNRNFARFPFPGVGMRVAGQDPPAEALMAPPDLSREKFSVSLPGQPKPQWKTMNATLTNYSTCIAACNACADACDHCAASCLREDDVQMMADCIAADIDCAQICRLAAGFMARASDFAADLCRVCADVCERCGEICARHDADHCQKCAEACRKCAEECRGM